MEGLLYLEKYVIGGPEFGIKKEFITERGRQLFHAPCMNREACCLQPGQLTGANWNHPLASGLTQERRLLHPLTTLRHSTNELLTELKTSSTSKLTKTVLATVWLKLNLDYYFFLKKKGIGNPVYFKRRAFFHKTKTRVHKSQLSFHMHELAIAIVIV